MLDHVVCLDPMDPLGILATLHITRNRHRRHLLRRRITHPQILIIIQWLILTLWLHPSPITAAT